MKSGKMRHGDKLVFLIKKFSTTAYEYKYNASCYLLISMLVWRDGGVRGFTWFLGRIRGK